MGHESDAPLDIEALERAFEEARAAGLRDEVPVGAALVDRTSGQILASAGNRIQELADPTAHAEILTLREAARILGVPRLPDCDLYVTLEPCAMCAGAIAHARIRRVIFAASDPKGGAVLHGPKFFSQPTCHHRPQIENGQRAEESSLLLKSFFKAKRRS